MLQREYNVLVLSEMMSRKLPKKVAGKRERQNYLNRGNNKAVSIMKSHNIFGELKVVCKKKKGNNKRCFWRT